jgi:YVTN family beta-propeller protein
VANSTTVVGVVATTTTGYLPTALAVDSANGWVYVADQESGELSVLNGTNVIATVQTGPGCTGVVYDSETEDVYATNLFGDSVTVVHGTSVVTTIPVGSFPLAPVYDAADGYVYVLDSTSNSVSILNSTAVVANISVGQDPINAVYDPANGYVYVTSAESLVETVFSGTSVAASIYLGLTGAFDTVYDAFNGLIYVINSTNEGGRFGGGVGTAFACIISGLTFLRSLEVGGGPEYGAVAAVDTADGWLYVPDAATDQVTIINGSTEVAAPLIGGLPTDALYNPADGQIYISDQGSYSVSVLNGTILTAQPGVGIYPEAMVADNANGDVYVANLGSSTISILGKVQGWAVEFVETGLATGTGWSVTVQGLTHQSTGSTILFYEPTGAYAYSVGQVTGYLLDTSATGITAVTSAGATINVVYSVTGPPPPSPKPFPVVPVAGGLIAAALVGLVAWAVLSLRRTRRGRIDRLAGWSETLASPSRRSARSSVTPG